MYLISIIIPHRNSLKTLSRAIKSIPQRDDIEIIVIDNSAEPISKNDIRGIDRQYNLLYSSPYKGAGCARNVGLNYATGKFLLFNDADDYFDTDTINTLVRNVENGKYNEYDIVFFKARAVNSIDGKETDKRNTYSNLFDDYIKDNSAHNLNRIRFYYSVPWGKLYKHDTIRNNKILFDEVPASNDIMFTTKAAMQSSSMLVEDKIIYNVTITEGSLTRTKSSKNLRSRFMVYINHNSYLKNHGYSKYCIDLLKPLKKLFRISIKDGFWGIKQIIKERANLFDFVYKYI